MFLEWDEKYSVKVKELDTQHQILFDVINEMSEVVERGRDYLLIAGILDSMDLYTKAHFLLEEKYMQDHNYPDFDEHKKQHQHFIDSIERFKKDLQDVDFMDIPKDVARFLKTWLTSHILMVDMKYSAFFNEKGLT